jgi:uncharacterized membrane protein
MPNVDTVLIIIAAAVLSLAIYLMLHDIGRLALFLAGLIYLLTWAQIFDEIEEEKWRREQQQQQS